MLVYPYFFHLALCVRCVLHYSAGDLRWYWWFPRKHKLSAVEELAAATKNTETVHQHTLVYCCGYRQTENKPF